MVRDRTNMLRRAMSDGFPEDEMLTDEFVDKALDLCTGCKGCSKDCPSEVDMVKMRTEVVHGYYQRNGSSPRDRLFANTDSLFRLGSTFAPLANAVAKVPGAWTAMGKTVGTVRGRSLPTSHLTSLIDWSGSCGGAGVPKTEADREVLLFPDTYTNYNHPRAGKIAVTVLEAMSIHVRIPDDVADSGRPPHSKGFFDEAHADVEQDVEMLTSSMEEGWGIVLCEPSDAVMLQSDYLGLLSGDDVKAVSANVYGVMEYVDVFRLDESLSFRPRDDSLTYHGHCHQESTKKNRHAVSVPRHAGFGMDPLDSMYCGMSGSFGHKAEHYSVPKAIEDILGGQAAESPDDMVVAPDVSCRTQLKDMDGATSDPPRPVEMLAHAIDA